MSADPVKLLDDVMDDAARKLEAELTEIFKDVKLVPTVLIEDIWSHCIAEDGALIVYLDMANGKTLCIRACVGEPVHINFVS